MARSVTWAGAGLRPAPSRRSSSFLQRAGSGAARRSRPLVLPARTMPANNRLQQIRPGPSASLRARSAGQLNRTLVGTTGLGTRRARRASGSSTPHLFGLSRAPFGRASKGGNGGLELAPFFALWGSPTRSHLARTFVGIHGEPTFHGGRESGEQRRRPSQTDPNRARRPLACCARRPFDAPAGVNRMQRFRLSANSGGRCRPSTRLGVVLAPRHRRLTAASECYRDRQSGGSDPLRSAAFSA